MDELTRLSGVTVSVTGPAQIVDKTRPTKRRGKAARGAAAGLPADSGLIIDALRNQDLEFVDSVELDIPPVARPKKRGAAAPASQVTLDVPLGSDEQAVILVEDEGEYRWIVDGKPLVAPAPPKRGKAAPPKRHMRFSIELRAAPPPPAIAAKRGVVKRNWLVEKLTGKVIFYVFSFAVKVAGKRVVKFFERNIEEGLVTITTPDPQHWTLLGADDPLPVTLPVDRPARVLLLVHGTFSSTVGSFGALGIESHGRDFINRALSYYDAVLGFDHRTLSVDPLKNARDLLARLRRVRWPHPPQIDMVVFSRGGLVARSLIEHLLPGSKWGGAVGRVVFVGCTNGGTQLAEPENWHRFADHYTNLALGATRALSLIPGAQGSTLIAGQVIRGVGALIKALATGTVTDKMAPGLAAMEPDGEFVTTINTAQAGQPAAVDAQYYAVTSGFEAGKALRTGATPELPPKLLMRIADWGADELYGEANDLVVHVRSMTEIDRALGDYVKAALDYGTNGAVYHTNYFTRDKTAAKLTEWFGLSSVALTPVKRGARRGAKVKSAAGRKATGAGMDVSSRRSISPKRGAKKAKSGVVLKKAMKMNGGGGGSGTAPSNSRSAIPERSKRLASSGSPFRRTRGAAAKAGRANGGGSAKAQVECYFRAEMDQEVVVNKQVTVDVAIARHALELTAGRVGEITVARVEAARKLIVEIAERRNFRVDGERRVEIDVPEPDAEARVCFDVTGLAAGEEGELWVQMRQGPIPLVTLKLKPRIVARASTTPVSRMPVEQELACFPVAEPPLDEIRIIEARQGDTIRYTYLVDLPSLSFRDDFTSPEIDNRDGYITSIMNAIGNAWAGTGRDQLEAFETDLKSIGARMFSELMPREMQDLLWENRNRINSVQVLSMEPFIPWELVYLKDPRSRVIDPNSRFLCELGLVRWLYDGWPPSRITLGRGRARYIIPTYTGEDVLPEAPREENMLRKLFRATQVPARALDVQKLLRTPGSFDLLHFGGHAEAAGADRTDARLVLDQTDDGSTENALLATTVAGIAELKANGRRPMVVLNACESARMGRTFSGMGGFASAFVERGAGVFIGTHWSVADAPALTFIEAFYKAFAVRKAGKKPVELREAVMKARQAARDGGDATWLSYVVYGHPRAVVTINGP